MSKPAIKVTNLWQAHAARWVLQEISFEVQPGEIAVLTGVNGVGKTTLLTTIAGMKSAVKGSVSVFGHRRRVIPDEERGARQCTVYLPDEAWLPFNMTLQEYLAAAGSLFEVDTADLPDRIDALLKLFALRTSRNQSVASLSAGQRKKAGLASALLADRKLLLLDEPFSGGLDPAGIMAVRRVLKYRAEHSGQTVLMTTPVTELVTELADRLLVLRDGQLAHNLTRAEILNSAPEGATDSEWLEALVFPNAHERVDNFIEMMPMV